MRLPCSVSLPSWVLLISSSFWSKEFSWLFQAEMWCSNESQAWARTVSSARLLSRLPTCGGWCQGLSEAAMQNHPTLLSRLLRRELSFTVACPVNSVSWSLEEVL